MIANVSNRVVLGALSAVATSAILFQRKANGNLCMDPKLSIFLFGDNGSAENNDKFRIQPSNNTFAATNTKEGEK
jgi:hypothetical protein